MRKNNKKGIALAIVIMLMLLLSIMGATFLGISLNQSRQAAIVDKGMQAYYLARSGAEATLSSWQNAPSASKPSGTLDAVYLDGSNNFTNNSASAIGNFVASITINPSDANQTVIRSVGVVGGIQKDVTILINKTVKSIVNPSNFRNGDDTGFYTLPSGQLNPDVTPWPLDNNTKGVVRNKGKNNGGLKAPNKNTVRIAQTFERILFDSTFSVYHNQVELLSNAIYFTKPIDFDKPGGAAAQGSLVLKIYGTQNGAVIERVSGGYNWGVVILQVGGVEKGYFFKDIPGGVILTSESDIQAQVTATNMELITDQDLLNKYKNYFGTTMNVTSYSILWTK